MLDDERLEGEIENALGVIECAFQDAIDNDDFSEIIVEMKRGYRMLTRIAQRLMDKAEGE